jgi:hypothetical protein
MLNVIYKLEFNDNLTISITIDKKTIDKEINWIYGEDYGEDLSLDFIITESGSTYIVYQISKEIPQYNDDRLLLHPFVRNEYASFSGSVGLFFPDIDFGEEINVTYESNYPLFISGIGSIENSYKEITTLNIIAKRLFVLTKVYYAQEKIIITYYPNSYFFIDLETINDLISSFLNRCYHFFGYQEDLIFVINYFGFKTDGTETGHGGMGNYAGFNFLVVEKKSSPSLKFKIKTTLLHEIFHHFNKSSGDYDTMWFSEGFTEFFSRYLSMNLSLFKKQCNKFIINYNLNPYRNSEISFMTKHHFWTNKFVERLPYVKGFCYALYLYRTYGNTFIENYKKIICDIKFDNLTTT